MLRFMWRSLTTYGVVCGFIIMFVGLLIFAEKHDQTRAIEISQLPRATNIGEVAISPHETMSMYEFSHPTRSGMTCLFTRGPDSRQAGLTCWRN